MPRVLVVEGQPEAARSLIRSLEATGLGLAVEATPSADRAVELAESERVDCLIVGGRFAGPHGAGLVQRIRDLDLGLPVVQVTEDTDEDASAGLRAADASLEEDEADPDEMRSVIEALLGET